MVNGQNIYAELGQKRTPTQMETWSNLEWGPKISLERSLVRINKANLRLATAYIAGQLDMTTSGANIGNVWSPSREY